MFQRHRCSETWWSTLENMMNPKGTRKNGRHKSVWDGQQSPVFSSQFKGLVSCYRLNWFRGWARVWQSYPPPIHHSHVAAWAKWRVVPESVERWKGGSCGTCPLFLKQSAIFCLKAWVTDRASGSSWVLGPNVSKCHHRRSSAVECNRSFFTTVIKDLAWLTACKTIHFDGPEGWT